MADTTEICVVTISFVIRTNNKWKSLLTEIKSTLFYLREKATALLYLGVTAGRAKAGSQIYLSRVLEVNATQNLHRTETDFFFDLILEFYFLHHVKGEERWKLDISIIESLSFQNKCKES